MAQQSKLVNIVGINSPIPELKGVASPKLPEMQDITNEKYGIVRENIQRAFQSNLEALEAKGKLAATLAASKGRSQRGSELTGLAETVVAGLQQYQQGVIAEKKLALEAWQVNERIKSQQEKEAAEAARAAQEAKNNRGSMLASAAVQASLLQLQTRIRENGREHGIHTTRTDIENILAEYSWLDPETLQALRTSAYSPLYEAEQQQTSQFIESAKELQTNQESMAKSTLQVGLAAYFARLENPRVTVEEANQLWQQVGMHLQQNTAGMDLESRMRIIAPLMEQAANAATTGEGARQLFVEKMSAYDAMYNWYQQARESGLINQPTVFKQALTLEAQRLGVPELADVLPDVLQESNQQLQWYETQQKLQIAGREQANEELAAQAPEYVNARSAQLAHSWFNSAGGQAQYEIAKAKDSSQRTPFENAAIGLYDSWQQGTREYRTLADQLSQAIQEYQTLLPKVDPTQTGGQFRDPTSGQVIPGESVFDPTAGEFIRVPIIDPQTGELLKLPTGTQAQLRTALERIRNRQAQMNQLVQQHGQNGFNLQNPTDTTQLQNLGARADAIEKAASALPSFRSLSGLPPNAPDTSTSFPNFNRGVGPGAPANPPVNPLLRQNGMVMPFASGQDMEVTATYGDGPGSNHGGRFHAGLDLASGRMWDADVGVLAVQGGTVINVFDWNGYGGTVMVKTPDGRIEQYSHLRAFKVKNGQTIPPGTILGIAGGGEADPMSGSSSGRHLHFQVWRAGVTDFGNPGSDTLNPMEYLKSIRHTEARPQGLGAPPTGRRVYTPTPGALTLFGGNTVNQYGGASGGPWVHNSNTNTSAPAEHVYTPSAPIETVYAPIDKRHYPKKNNPTANYGYEAIARDPAFARAIAEAGDALGIPGQFLADVMAYESSTRFDPHIDNGVDGGADRGAPWGHGYLGLIQINGDWLREHGMRKADVLKMSRAEYVKRILIPYFRPGARHLNTVEDVLAYVFIGPGSVDMSAAERGVQDDGWTTFAEYMRELGGPAAGRRYRTNYDSFGSTTWETHTSNRPGCPICAQHLNRYKKIIPHDAPISRGGSQAPALERGH